ncbi:hypothetical protein DM860_001047 [Cuscuta australis]|uniref:Uncharacterized protein n=1 Tax=Cuscuta australis TaxID=267555 RepID=A0A328DSM0_9ASTE|nr:hypothetical protein DM860_001047 [Cuscuta australis]
MPLESPELPHLSPPHPSPLIAESLDLLPLQSHLALTRHNGKNEDGSVIGNRPSVVYKGGDPLSVSQSKQDLSQDVVNLAQKCEENQNLENHDLKVQLWEGQDLQKRNTYDQADCSVVTSEVDVHKQKELIALAESPSSYNIQYPQLLRSCLSRFAAEFIPLKPNAYAALFDQQIDLVDGSPLKDDEFDKIDDGNLVLSNNALEDIREEREGPILYTHSEGEDRVFNDNILKPLQIDYSRMFKIPFDLGREFKGRHTFSPSQIVTRSRAKILEEGRKKTPIGWEERSDGSESNFAEDITNFFKECCPNKPEPATKKQSTKKPLTKGQKKKSKKKLKKKMARGHEKEDSD